MRRFIVTVDRDSLARFREPHIGLQPILIEDTDATVAAHQRAAEVELHGAKIVFGPMRRDGARVWIEADLVEILR